MKPTHAALAAALVAVSALPAAAQTNDPERPTLLISAEYDGSTSSSALAMLNGSGQFPATLTATCSPSPCVDVTWALPGGATAAGNRIQWAPSTTDVTTLQAQGTVDARPVSDTLPVFISPPLADVPPAASGLVAADDRQIIWAAAAAGLLPECPPDSTGATRACLGPAPDHGGGLEGYNPLDCADDTTAIRRAGEWQTTSGVEPGCVDRTTAYRTMFAAIGLPALDDAGDGSCTGPLYDRVLAHNAAAWPATSCTSTGHISKAELYTALGNLAGYSADCLTLAGMPADCRPASGLLTGGAPLVGQVTCGAAPCFAGTDPITGRDLATLGAWLAGYPVTASRATIADVTVTAAEPADLTANVIKPTWWPSGATVTWPATVGDRAGNCVGPQPTDVTCRYGPGSPGRTVNEATLTDPWGRTSAIPVTLTSTNQPPVISVESPTTVTVSDPEADAIRVTIDGVSVEPSGPIIHDTGATIEACDRWNGCTTVETGSQVQLDQAQPPETDTPALPAAVIITAVGEPVDLLLGDVDVRMAEVPASMPLEVEQLDGTWAPATSGSSVPTGRVRVTELTATTVATWTATTAGTATSLLVVTDT